LVDELEFLGAAAQRCLREVGLFWPPNVYVHAPIFAAARGGSVITGLDGDGLFGDWRWRHAQDVLHGHVRPRPRDLVRVGLAVAPKAARRRALRGRSAYVPDWLSSPAQADYRAFVFGRLVDEPRRWDRRVAWYATSRALYLTQRNLALIGALDDVEVGNPLLHPEFLAGLIREGGAAGLGDRTRAMRHLFGDLLPAAVVERRDKAAFGEALWGEHARSFVRSWRGEGVDPELVDPEKLRASWEGDSPIFHSLTLLHAAWLAVHAPATASPSGGEERPAQEK
jgi:asparagine synthase (glutamine-hydrolysing)